MSSRNNVLKKYKRGQMKNIMTYIFNEFATQMENNEKKLEKVKKIQSSLVSVRDYIKYRRSTVPAEMTTTTIAFADIKDTYEEYKSDKFKFTEKEIDDNPDSFVQSVQNELLKDLCELDLQ